MKAKYTNPASYQRAIKRVKSLVLNREIEMDFTHVSYVLGTRVERKLAWPLTTTRLAA